MNPDTPFRQNPVVWLIGAVIVGAIIYLLSPILAPFLMAFVLAYLGEPIVRTLENWKLPRWAAILVGYLLILIVMGSLVLLVLPLAQEQLEELIKKAPSYKSAIMGYMQPVVDLWHSYNGSVQGSGDKGDGSTAGSVVSLAKDAAPQAGGAVSSAFDAVARSGMAVAKTLMNIFLIPVLAFYLLRDWDKLSRQTLRLVPEHYRSKTGVIAKDVDEVLQGFLRGQLLVMASLAFMYSTGLWLIGLEFGLLIGVIAGLLSVVPYLGTLTGLVLAAIAMVVQTGEWQPLWMVGLVFGVGQFIEGNILTPKLVGDKIDLHPVVVIFVVLAGGQLFGFTGILLALPVAAMVWVIIKRTVGTIPSDEPLNQ
ncbi:AI-2E family transporter [Granulosicoccus antarcticus]|uniref:AI-2 transport protein TqsA n=1 Tax=Granulosicoccus antarcticus IMCC3135 TaxID=1192854 RepID=A0A2Z2NP21_9GAMM|nr:AI-2E family transporter [Granulosicoccus antarcticus]ASJ72993.1 AI-2 transport protein TqsA [Granulosicoccus antarcticus IMCC3135]